MANRWIMYAQINMPCNQSFRVTAHESLEWCKASLDKFSRAVGDDNVSATLYTYTDEAWRSAREFEEVGCPLDCADRIIERGPRGALRMVNN